MSAPSHDGAGGSFVISSLPSIPHKAQISPSLALSDLSPKDKPWDKHRSNADSVQNHYFHSQDFQKYARRVSECSQLLQFGIVPDDAAKRKLKLTGARFCRVRHCPVCQWRRSLMWKAKAYKVLPKVVEQSSLGSLSGDDSAILSDSSLEILPFLPGDFGGEVRFTDDGRVSVYDAIGFTTGHANPRQAWNDLIERVPEVVQKVDNFQFPGRGQRLTPVASLQVFLEILVTLPGKIELVTHLRQLVVLMMTKKILSF